MKNMIKIKDIKNFVENHFGIKDASVKDRLQRTTIIRSYIIYLCMKYAEDIVTNKRLCNMLNIEQHGTIINALIRVTDRTEFDKQTRKELSVLENEFLANFKPSEITISIMSYDELKTKRRLLEFHRDNYDKRIQIQNLKTKINLLNKKLKNNN